jgi:hypothetical protein
LGKPQFDDFPKKAIKKAFFFTIVNSDETEDSRVAPLPPLGRVDATSPWRGHPTMVVPDNPSPSTAPEPAAGPQPPPAAERPRRSASDAKRKAAQANGRLGRGKKSMEGLAASALNAVKGGMTAKTVFFLPGEDPDAYYRTVDSWIAERGAVGDAECALLGLAVYNLLKIERTANATGAAGTEIIENLANAEHDRVQAEVHTLKSQLPEEPARTVDALRQTSQGCFYLLNQWELIKEWLAVHNSFEFSQRRHVLALCGWRPADLFRDARILQFDRQYLTALHGPGKLTAADAARIFIYDHLDDMGPEEFERRLESVVRDLPAAGEGRALLRKFVDERIAELTERIELLGLREERALEIKAGKAEADTSADGQTRERYHAMASRGLGAAIRQFLALKAERRKRGDGDDDEESDRPQGEETAQTPSDAGDARAVEARAQNEATVSQVADSPCDCDDTDGTPDDPGDPIPADDVADHRPMVDEHRRWRENQRLRE